MSSIAHIAQQLIPAPKNIYKYVGNGTTDDIIKTVLKADETAHIDTKQFAEKLKGFDHYITAQNIWYFIKQNIKYKIDPVGKQFIKSPSKLWGDKEGDCKSFSVFAGSILKNLGIPYAYRFTSYKDYDSTPTHVYIVIPAMRGHNEILLDAVWNEFDKEKKYAHKKDMRTTEIYSVSGVGNVPGKLNIEDPSKLTHGELDLLIAKQNVELNEQLSRGRNAKGFAKQKEIIEDALEAVKSQNPESKIGAIIELNENGFYDQSASVGAVNSKAYRRRQINKTAAQLGSVGIGRKPKTKAGKLLQRVGKSAKNTIKAAAKVATAPARLALKGILEVLIPASGLFFLYLFVADDKAVKMTAQGQRKRKKVLKLEKFIVDVIGMKQSHFRGLVRNGILKKTGKNPEAILKQRGMAGIGFVLTASVIMSAVPKVLELIKKISELFGKKPEESVSESDAPDLEKDFEKNAGDVTRTPVPEKEASSEVEETGTMKKGWC